MGGDSGSTIRAERPLEYQASEGVGQIARPAGAAFEVKTFNRKRDEARSPEAPGKVAVIVCHGMGQQVPYETIDMIAGSLLAGSAAPSAGSKVRQVKFGDDLLGRAEIMLERNGEQREVHIYETYWAPLTAGKVTLADVVWFLFKAALGGLVSMAGAATKSSLGFDRWMFGGFRWIRVHILEVAALAFALLAICCLFLLYLAYAWTVVPYVVSAGPSLGKDLVQDLRAALVLFAGLLVVGGFVLLLLGLVRAWLTKGFLARLLSDLISLGALVLLLGTCALGACVFVVYGHHVFQSFGSSAQGCTYGWVHGILQRVGGATSRAVWFYSAVAVLGAVFFVLRWFLLEYMGDVTAYVAAHTVSKFNELRSQIQAVAFKVFSAVYGAKEDNKIEYDTVVVTGHSLGSVLAYDTLNAFINWDQLQQANAIHVLQRTPMLVTFGSPLDKTAFLFRNQVRGAIFREALAATKQPMILTYGDRPKRWVNIFNHADWISGSLDAYDDPTVAPPRQLVQNVEDQEGFFPLLAHTEYPGHPELRQYLLEGIFRVP